MHRLFSLSVAVSICISIYAQQNPMNDSIINSIMQSQNVTGNEEGLQLIQSGDYNGANRFLSNAISQDESDRTAYFQRGVSNWALSDTLSACRDWSAVLAMGDTDMFNLLESKCHSSMIIEDDTIPSKQYRKMWAKPAKQGDEQNAKTVVEEMPQFPGGDLKLFEYISSNLNHPPGNKHGTVYINFLISPKGKVLYPYVVRGIGKVYDKEALRLIRSMPDWKPGKDHGKAVFVRSSLPVRF